MSEGIYIQLVAILAALGWTFLQVCCLFIATQCVFGIVNLGTNSSSIREKILLHAVTGAFYSLFILPFISLVMFYFATINIQGWYELKPSIWVFVTWCGGLFMFFFFISLTEWFVCSSENKQKKRMNNDN